MIKGVIFDMDGTITVPYIDWKALRAEIGASEGMILLDYIYSLDKEKQEWAMALLEKREEEAALNSELNDGLLDLLDYLREKRIKTALVTNNNRRSVNCVLFEHNLSFNVVLSREDGIAKPSEDLLLKALTRLGIEKDEVISVGDGRFDMEAASRAELKGVLLTNGKSDLKHHVTIESLTDLKQVIETSDYRL